MGKLFSSALVVSVLAMSIAAQSRMPGQPDNSQHNGRTLQPRDYSTVIGDMFAPVTEKLNLTKEQEFQIVAIVTETEVKSTPLIQALAVADHELSELAFTGQLDDPKITEKSDQEARLLSEMTQMKVRAKLNIFKILTADQRSLVAQQF